MATIHRARPALKIKKRNTASVVARANAVANGFGANSKLFATASPTPGAIENQVAVEQKAEALAGTKAKGAAAARDVQRNLLVGMLETAANYVQGIADGSASMEQAVAVIEAAGLVVALVARRTKAVLAATLGPELGSVVLDANATVLGAAGGRKTFFNWQSTVDGKSFVTLPSTPSRRPRSRTSRRSCSTASACASRRRTVSPDRGARSCTS